MLIKQSYTDFDYGLNLGRYFFIVELGFDGIETDSKELFDKASNFKNILIKGDIIQNHKEIVEFTSKLYKFDPSIKIYIEYHPIKLIKFRDYINFIIIIKNDYSYNEDVLDYYSKKNSSLIINAEYFSEFILGKFLPKEKLFIKTDEIDKNVIKFCLINGYNFLIDFTDIFEKVD